MRKKKAVTMQDIADSFQISKVTVSKALNGKDGVGDELKQKILDKASEIGYKAPKNTAENMTVQKNIAIFLNEKFTGGTANFYLRLYQRLSAELEKLGFLGNLFVIDKKHKDKRELKQLLEVSHVCGSILLGSVSKTFLKEITNMDIPCILVDFYNTDVNMDSVVTENIYSTYELTDYLFECGHRKIGFVGSVFATTSIRDRFLGYYRRLMESGIELRKDWVLEDRNEENEPIDFLLPEEMPDAFVCNCDDTAYRFVGFLKQEGYQVPENVSIVSFDNEIYSELCEPPLTTVAVDMESMARESVQLITEKVENPTEENKGIIYIKGNIIYRDSVKGLCRKYCGRAKEV